MMHSYLQITLIIYYRKFVLILVVMDDALVLINTFNDFYKEV